jgi:hypothetical protein
MKPQLSEQKCPAKFEKFSRISPRNLSDFRGKLSCMAEFNSPPLFYITKSKHKSGGGSNSHSNLCSLHSISCVLMGGVIWQN